MTAQKGGGLQTRQKVNIRFVTSADINDRTELVSLTVDGYPYLNRDERMENLHQYIDEKKALISQ